MKTNLALLPAVGALVTALLTSAPANGQSETSPPNCDADPPCTALKSQASAKSKSGDLVEALRLYRLAYEVRPDPRLWYNVGRLLHKQGQTAEAVAAYQKFLAAPILDEQQPQQAQKAREYLAQLQTPLAASPQMPVGSGPDAISSITPAATTRTDARPIQTPVYKKWWFWTVIGVVVVAGIAGGVAGGVAANRSLPEPVVRPFSP